MNTNETAPVTANDEKLVTKYVSNGMIYTITCRPIADDDFVSLRTYLGYKPDREVAEQVAKAARISRQRYITETVNTPAYQGKILKYTTEFLDGFFKATPKTATVTVDYIDTHPYDNNNDDDLPF